VNAGRSFQEEELGGFFMTDIDIRSSGIWARVLNVVLGAWLVVSDLVWRHGEAASTNTWICGLLVIAFALWALWMPRMRYWNTLLGAWLIFAAFVLEHFSSGTRWNNVILGGVILLVSLVPGRPLPDRRAARAPTS
jgi:hypothetical protein